ncbi:hypothetical protein DCAR_0209787 [Daucus carota subsp. sativus]|uniref:AAA+ ATPase domain-containing protein n=1 Tax=Daucus carota subsp. sativus TaxID=79200 RepID=A0AAF0WLD6_DAUCS|nr:hypothetical protein DCAR_0209787 [Daucus carota subsp. sativus]
MIYFTLFVLIISISFSLFFRWTTFINVVKQMMHSIEDHVYVYQLFKVPELNENLQENQFYRKVSTYVNSLSSSIEDSDFTNLFSSEGKDIILYLDDNQIVHDTFLGARISWKYQVLVEDDYQKKKTFVLKMKKRDKRRILQSYLQHIDTVSDEIEERCRRELKLFINTESHQHRRWRSTPLAHPATLNTIVMDSDLKIRIMSDLESFLESKEYYHRLGRVWKRSYLLYGPSGTGKSSFVAAMAKSLNYDVYDVDLSNVSDDSDLKMLLVQTRRKSLIVVEDLDRFLNDSSSSSVSLSGLLNFMDGIVSSCSGDEKIMVFTMNYKELIDPPVLRPGRVDVHIYFPLCDFNMFLTLADTYLGVKDHKMFPHVEETFEITGATLSPAEIAELMVMNRSSPSRAFKSVMTALQINKVAASSKLQGRWIGDSSDQSESSSGILNWKDVSSPAIKEIRKFYGVLSAKIGDT